MYYLTIALRCFIGAVFSISFLGKVTGRQAFTAFVASVGDMLPAFPARAVAVLVVAAEPTVCLLLAWPARDVTAAGFVLAAALLVAFTTGIVSVMRRGVRTPCRCFGAGQAPLGPRHLVRNGVLLTAAILGAALAHPASSASVGGVVVAVCAGLAAAGLVAAFDDLLDLFRPIDPLPGEHAGIIRGDLP